MKKLTTLLMLTALCIPFAVSYADETQTDEAEIDLESIRYNRSRGTSEIKMKIYNKEYKIGGNELYYAMYYLNMDCTSHTYKPMLIEGYNNKNELMLVDYEPREWKPITQDSNLDEAYKYACGQYELPKNSGKTK